MNTHISMIHNEHNVPVLLVSTQAPLDVLHASAASRFLAVTQMMESLRQLLQLANVRRLCRSCRRLRSFDPDTGNTLTIRRHLSDLTGDVFLRGLLDDSFAPSTHWSNEHDHSHLTWQRQIGAG